MSGAGQVSASSGELRRDLDLLARHSFDLVVVGGGIFGAFAAWDAALRGLDVALVERADFAEHTSAHSFKMVHGGIRYIQHGDIRRIRESCRERSALLRIAPHLVQPLPILIPTYGHGKNGRALLAAGMAAYDLLTLDRNRGIGDPGRRIPRSRLLSRRAVLEAFPGLERADLTGGAVFCDGQMYNPTRIVLSVLRSAAARGAMLANRLEAVGLDVRGDRVQGLHVRDRSSGERFTIRTAAVLNAAGPFAEKALAGWLGRSLPPYSAYSRDACFVVRRRFDAPFALAVLGRSRDADAVMAREARHLFIVPWRDFSLVGVWHRVWRQDPDRVAVERQELEEWLEEINGAYPGLGLGLSDIRLCQAGLLPFGDASEDHRELSYGKRSLILDHARDHRIQGLVTLIGVRYTMGRGDAQRALETLLRGLGRVTPRPRTDRIPVFGGDFENFEELVQAAKEDRRMRGDARVARALAHNYGSAFGRVLRYVEEDPELGKPLSGSSVLAAEIVHGIREEMAERLADLVLRRTDLATGGDPGPALEEAGRIAARELGWSRGRLEREIAEVRQRFPQQSLRTV